jgi:allophanate hydrolase
VRLGPRRRLVELIVTRHSLDFDSLRSAYLSGTFRPTDVVRDVFRRIVSEGARPIWTSLVSQERALERASRLEADPLAQALPLYGIPFAVKDNIDVTRMDTTAGCPSFSYAADSSSPVVDLLLDAGGVLIGKTNLDQFATGLVGTRSPYGACPNAFDKRYISGGSSSGSALAVAKGLVSFALGTDTAGSGRIPAAFNNIVGLKPTRGSISTRGVVPACRSLDCVSILALTCADANTVLQQASVFDACDPFSRQPRPKHASSPWLAARFRLGVPRSDVMEFFGDPSTPELYGQAIERLKSIGGDPVEIDFSPFHQASELLYEGPWVAERLAAIEGFVELHSSAMHPVVYEIIAAGPRYNAVDVFRGQYQLEGLRRAAKQQWDRMDLLVLPTAGTIYTKESVEANPLRLNANLGYYTNFVNLMDLSAVAVPAGFRPDGLPFGISLIGRPFSDDALLLLADAFHRAEPGTLGATGKSLSSTPCVPKPECPPGCVFIAVVGAHLSGQPLNWQLTERGARLHCTTKTADDYHLYSLAGSAPPKPALVREPGFSGPGIEVEVWAMPEVEFGGFVADVPFPLAVGNVELEKKGIVKGFICEPFAITGSVDITVFGSWRAYLAST